MHRKFAKLFLKILVLIQLTSCGTYVVKNSKGLPLADLRELPAHWHKSPEELAKDEGLQRAQRFANHGVMYSIAALDVYDKPRSEKEPIQFPSTENWEPILHEEGIQNSIGFAGRAWLRTKSNGKQELVVAYRGTQFSEANDWLLGNLVPVSGALRRNQYDAALEYALSSIQVCGKETNVVFTGHSLGGGLAEYAHKFVKNSRAVTFDTSPNQGRIYSLFKSRQSKKTAVRIYEKGELLSFLRFIMSPDLCLEDSPEGSGVRAAWMDFYNSNPLAAHDMHDLCTSIVKVSASTGNREALSVIEQLEEQWEAVSLEPLRLPYNVHRKKLRESILRRKY
ncbi:hypothetical protein N9891_00080 [bacterium]|nr:hypothetical protein [bacterium]